MITYLMARSRHTKHNYVQIERIGPTRRRERRKKKARDTEREREKGARLMEKGASTREKGAEELIAGARLSLETPCRGRRHRADGADQARRAAGVPVRVRLVVGPRYCLHLHLLTCP